MCRGVCLTRQYWNYYIASNQLQDCVLKRKLAAVVVVIVVVIVVVVVVVVVGENVIMA